MSDILIPNIELPKEDRLQLSIYPNGTVINHSTLKVEKTTREAIEVPTHGRLVDADKMFGMLERSCGTDSLADTIAREILKGLIKNAPTAIEASKERE